MNKGFQEKAKKEFEAFFNIAWDARHKFCLYTILYEQSEDRIKLLNESASEFFGVLQEMWHEHILLDICRLTDPCEGRNLTIDYFICRYKHEFSCEEETQVKEIMNLIESFRNRNKKPRNKILTHIDKETVLSNKPLGGLTAAEIREGKQMCEMIEQFYDNLEKIINIISSKIYGNKPEDYVKPLDPTGNAAEELIFLLKKIHKE